MVGVGNALKNGIDAFAETHVEHFVGLVEHYALYHREVCHLALHEVDQAARSGNNHMGATLQGTNLALDVGTSIDRQDMETLYVARQVLEVFGNLQTQFASGTKHHCARQR